jgi:hypothetical protein
MRGCPAEDGERQRKEDDRWLLVLDPKLNRIAPNEPRKKLR